MNRLCKKTSHWRGTCLSAMLVSLLLVPGAAPTEAGGMRVDEGGVLNPAPYTLERILLKVERGEITDLECIYGYETAKHGKHQPARIILNYCAGVRQLPQAMNLLAWMDENGYGLEGGPNLKSAAEWDRRAADLGDSNSQFNYGLKLLRGRGVTRDVAEGRRYIDLAAANGDGDAQKLAEANYDLSDVVGIGKDRLHKGAKVKSGS